jgi:NAD(P)-dependent dehydrogenase (short-subunit alcohol dehydrogenase family)
MIYEDLKGKKVLVSGTGSGIGSATAILLSRQACFITGEYIAVNDGLYTRA